MQYILLNNKYRDICIYIYIHIIYVHIHIYIYIHFVKDELSYIQNSLKNKEFF